MTPVRHPGHILLDEFMDPFDISQNELARQIRVSPRRVNEIVQGKRAITADTAIRLQEIFGLPAEYWMELQAKYDLDQARLPRTRRDRNKSIPAPKRSRAARRHDELRFRKLAYVRSG